MRGSDKIEYLDGLRGIASVVVYIHHFVLCFSPLYFSKLIQRPPFFELLSDYPWMIFINGSFAVDIFFVHSGLVLSLKFFKNYKKLDLYSSLVRRYFRLTIPITASILFSYLLLKLNLYKNKEVGIFLENKWLQGYLNFEPSFFEAIKQSLYSTYFYFKSSTTYNNVLWTISNELIGSYFIFALIFISRNIYFILGALVLTLIFPKYSLNSFVLGMVIAWCYVHKESFLKNKWVGFLFLIFGFILSVLVKGNYGALGAFFVIYGLFAFESIQKLLKTKLISRLGKYSFSLYIIHIPILYSLSVTLHQIPLWINFMITSCICFGLSHFLYEFVDKKGIELSHWISKKLKLSF